MPTIIKWLATFSLIILYFLMFYVGYLIFWPIRTIETENSILPVITHQVKRGTALIYQVNYCRYQFYGATVYRTLYGTNNNNVYPLAPVNTVTSPGCRTANVYLMIPSSLQPGTYYVNVLLKIQVNLLRQQTLETRTQSFEVTN